MKQTKRELRAQGESEETTLLFAGTISPTTCPAAGPTEGWRKKPRRKTAQEEGRDKELVAKTQEVLCPAGEPRTTQETKGDSKQKQNKTKSKTG